jgi:hypothetical protein
VWRRLVSSPTARISATCHSLPRSRNRLIMPPEVNTRG